MCAIAARFSTHPKLDTSPDTSPNFLRGEEWAAPARRILQRRNECPSLTVLTSMLLLAMHEFGTCHGGRSWAFAGQAIRMALRCSCTRTWPTTHCSAARPRRAPGASARV